MNLNTPVNELKGVGDKTAELFKKLGLFSCNDLIHYYPRAYDKYEKIGSIDISVMGERCAILATVKSSPKIMRFGGKSVLSFFVNDGNNSMEIRFFNSPYLLKAFKVGDKKIFRGIIKSNRDRILMDQPRVYSYDDYIKLENKIVPIYPLTKDLSNEKLSKCITQVFNNINLDEDYLTENECDSFNFIPMNQALTNIHFPKDENYQYFARRRIVFEEFLQFIRLTRINSSVNEKTLNAYPMIPVAECNRLLESLPYQLTNAQKRALDDIFNDMTGEFAMNRLVQGDVGSGKTIIAVLALLLNAANGYQGALMAPTEVLARQHFEAIRNMTERYGLCFKPVLLTGKMSSKDKRETLDRIESGDANVVIGTHAIIQENVSFKKLSLVITDEQHRFGVKQREDLKDKGNEPHLLVMSATPIPRTLALILFAGLSISVIDELPKNRIPISNCVVNSSYREKIYEKIRSEVTNGHQAYVICPMVYESEQDEFGLKSVEQHSKDIKAYFGDGIRVGCLSGKMKTDEKNRVMENFKEHNIDILVSTTVVEVGIDVPNATVILIENAERFGLSQLHQLRGRVGRGQYPSYCILLSDSSNDSTKKRLCVLNETNDGFKIANEDMKMRGPGELNGIKQSGDLQFGLSDITNDGDLLLLASEKYEILSERMPSCTNNLIDFRTI